MTFFFLRIVLGVRCGWGLLCHNHCGLICPFIICRLGGVDKLTWVLCSGSYTTEVPFPLEAVERICLLTDSALYQQDEVAGRLRLLVPLAGICSHFLGVTQALLVPLPCSGQHWDISVAFLLWLWCLWFPLYQPEKPSAFKRRLPWLN